MRRIERMTPFQELEHRLLAFGKKAMGLYNCRTSTCRQMWTRHNDSAIACERCCCECLGNSECIGCELKCLPALSAEKWAEIERSKVCEE